MSERRKATFNIQRGQSSSCFVTPENPTSNLVDSKVIIQTAEGEYEGVVKHVWGNMEKISLSKVFALPSRKAYFGVLNFFKKDIVKITIVEPKSRVQNQTKEKNAVKLQPIHVADLEEKETPDYMENSDEDDDSGSAVAPRPTLSEVEKYSRKGEINWHTDSYEGAGPESVKCSLPTKYVIIDKINKDFHSSLEDINSCSFVGIAMDCIKGRLGEISLLCVSTNNAVYLFDIMTLGMAAPFDNGLRAVLETTKVTKIVHDCRLLSDSLFHLCKVTLANVFDTQVGDVILYLKQNNNKLPQYVSSLYQCLKKYLKLEEHFLPKDELFQKNSSHWKMRPLPSLCQQNAIRNVIFLQELRGSIMEEILADLTLGIDIYINAVRKASMEELALNLGSPHMLPPAMSCLTTHEMKLLHHYSFNSNMNNGDNMWDQPTLPSKEKQEVQSLHQMPNNSRTIYFKGTDTTVKNSNIPNVPPKTHYDALANGVSNLGLTEKVPCETGNNMSLAEALKNVKWTSNYTALVKNKCSPAGKI